MEKEADFEGIIRKVGNSLVVTIPKEVVIKLSLGPKSGIAIHARRWENESRSDVDRK